MNRVLRLLLVSFCFFLMIVSLASCSYPQSSAKSMLHNFSQPGLCQGNRVAEYDNLLWVVDASETISVYTMDGTLHDCRSLVLPEEEGAASWTSVFLMGSKFLVRNNIDGKVWIYTPDSGSLTPISETIQSAWFFVANNSIYYAKRYKNTNTVYQLSTDGTVSVLSDHVTSNIKNLFPTDNALYFCDAESSRLYKVDYGTREETLVSSMEISEPVVAKDEVYFYTGKASSLSGNNVPADAQKILKVFEGKIYYSTSTAGLVCQEAENRTVMEDSGVLTVEVGHGWIFYTTRDGQDHLVFHSAT